MAQTTLDPNHQPVSDEEHHNDHHGMVKSAETYTINWCQIKTISDFSQKTKEKKLLHTNNNG
jgi:hypothetical protein